MNNRPESKYARAWISHLLALTAWALLGAGCGTVPQSQVVLPQSAGTSPMITEINNALTAAALQTPAASPDYRLGPEDLLQITLFNIPQGEVGATPRLNEVRVSQEGKISLPLLGDVEVAGLTPSGLEQLLRGRYDQYLHNPQVGVQVKEFRSQPVTVTGAVRNPVVYQLTSPKTLIDLLAIAGGINERAGGQVHLYRQGPEGRQSYVIDLLALASKPALVNMPVQAGDIINVQQAGTFFVDGAVRNPGSYPLSRPYTLTQALAVAGGVNRELASYSELAIYRHRNGVEAQMIPVDLSAIWDGKANDPTVESDDVIVVPMSTAKYIVRRFFGTIGFGSVPGYIP
ncbi:MAG: polysaccharide biosynthesis/export family protein [Candidatus Entotheonellia bacterium]